MGGYAEDGFGVSPQKKIELLRNPVFSGDYKEAALRGFLLEGDLEHLDLLAVMYYRRRDYQLAYYFACLGWEKKNQFFCRFYEVLSLLQLGYYRKAEDIFRSFSARFCRELENSPCCLKEILDIFIVFYFPWEALPSSLKGYLAANPQLPAVMLYELQEKIIERGSRGDIKKLVDYIADVIIDKLDTRALQNHACSLVALFDEKRRERYLSYTLEEGWLEPLLVPYVRERGMLKDGEAKGQIRELMLDVEEIKRRTRFFYQGMRDETFEIVSYPWSCQAGNMHLVKVRDRTVIFDLGDKAGEGYGGLHMRDFLKRNGTEIEDVKAVFISHAHFDHWGGLGIFKDSRVPVYLTEDTCNLIGKAAPEIFRGIDIRLIREGRPVLIDDSLAVEAFPNGHVLGSVGFILRAEGKRLLYTGDFCLHDQALVKGFDLDKVKGEKTDVLIMETTYGRQLYGGLDYDDSRVLLARLVEEIHGAGLKILLPAFAAGRAQEIIAALGNMKHKVPVLLDGKAVPVFHYFANRVAGFRDKGDYVHILPDGSIEGNLVLYPVIIASSGMLKRGTTSDRYLDGLLRREKFAVIQTGYMEEDENVSFVKAFDDYKLVWFKVSLSAHAGYSDLLYTLECLHPDRVVMVHGEGLEGFYPEPG